ncbi:sensor histidine kinase [Robiginitomaculum antarcticum]|uniref:sensor histidine kinase n=1 Tax=Robiginitomaculum antarcticum TaxID=437507 RepID=UPI000380DB9C|nr:PAS domain-containing sensor histidine kinase [Robiginitomaculum antarcticum]
MPDVTPLLPLIITTGAVALAILTALWALRMTVGPRRAAQRWKERCAELDQTLSRIDSAFSAFPGLVLVWHNDIPNPRNDWGKPNVYGSTAALASLVRFAEPGDPRSFARNVLNGIADHETVSGSNLRSYVETLRTKGEAFSATINLPGGQIIEADGMPAGAQVVLWLQDASVRSEDARTAISRFQSDQLEAGKDPVAFMHLMQRAPFPVWKVTGTGRLDWVNKAYADAVGAKTAQIVLSQQIVLDEKADTHMQNVLMNHERRTEVRHVIVEGRRRSMAMTLFPISGGAGGIAMDVTEAETLRETLTRHVEAHDEVLNRMAEGIIKFTADQKIRFHNTAFEKMFGLDSAALKDIRHGELLGLLREKRRLPEQLDFKNFKAQELSYYTDFPDESPDELWNSPDGRTLRLVRMRDPMGGLTLLFEDMTDEMTMQSRFNQQINVQSATLDKLSEGIAVFGADARLQISNAAFANIWQLPEELLQDAPHFDALIERSLKLYHDREFWAEMKARVTDPSPQVRRHVFSEIKRSDDSIIKYLSRPLPDGATLIAWDDVTTARKAEAALIARAEAMEAADRIKSEFVGHVSYQLRTPLTTISGYSELLALDSTGELNDVQEEYLFAVKTAADDLAKTIDDILDIAAIDADVLDLELGDVDIAALVHSAAEFVATKAADTQRKLTVTCPDDIGVIRADEKRLKQVLHNLLSNALAFTTEGGRVDLTAERTPAGVRISVSDDGVGIAHDDQIKVFESFQSKRGGAGLGLALVQRFVERHNGWVDMESEEGRGTKVTVYLPENATLTSAHPELSFG